VVRIVASVLGAASTAWGIWALYVGIANYDPMSELPRWFAFAFAGLLLAIGASLFAVGLRGPRQAASQKQTL
jgi:hypothetical protein